MANFYSQNEWGPWSKAAIEEMISTKGGYDPNLMQYGLNDTQLSYWQNVLNQINQSGADYSFQTQGLSAPVSHSGTVGDVFKDFVTSPAFLTLAGGTAGVYGGAAGAAAGGAEGAAGTGAAAGSGGALGSGITATAAEGGLGAGLGSTGAGATGLNSALAGGTGTASGLGGAAGTGLTTTGALGAGSSLAPGYFATEGLAGGGGSAVGAPATGGGSSIAPSGGGLSLTDLAAKAVPSALGMYASGKQSDAYSGLAGQYMQMGEPYRQRLSDLYNDPSSFLNSPEVQVPVQQGTNILARSLSTQGNPAGSGNALQELQNYSTNQLWNRLGQEKDRLGGFGGLTAYNQAAPQAALQKIGADQNFWQAFGGGFADVFGTGQKKDKTLDDLLRAYYA